MSIRQIQQTLKNLGYDPGPVDGINGPRTKAAVKAFQRDNGLAVDGIVGPNTTAALQSASSGGGGGGGEAGGVSQSTRDRIVSQYPAYAFLIDHPEIGPLLQAAIDGSMDEQTFQAKLQSTNWWKTTSEASRAWFALLNTDPATANIRKQEMAVAIRQMAGSLNLNYTDADIAWFTDHALSIGITAGSPMMRDMLASHAANSGERTKTSRGQLQSTALNDYMVKLSDGDYHWWAVQIAAGKQTQESYEQMLRETAMSRYGSIAGRIQAGETPGRIFSQYSSLISDEMGTSVSNQDLLNDPRWSKMLGVPMENGQQRIMTLSEAQQHVRKQDAWWSGQKGKALAADFTSNLLHTFGER